MDVFKKIIKVPKGRDITVHVPESIPVNTPVELRLSIPKEMRPASIKIIDQPIDIFLVGDEADSVDEWTTLASSSFDS